MPKLKSDVYISSRRLGGSVKVSLHEPGPSRFALTNEWVQKTEYQAPKGRDRRLAIEWERPRPRAPFQIARPLSIIVPYDEVVDQEFPESGQIFWAPPPPKGTCVHFDIIYTPAGAIVNGHPGSRSMGTGLVGMVQLENDEKVFVTWIVRAIEEKLRHHITKLRTTPIYDINRNQIEEKGMLAFGTEPNPDANDETCIGTLLDVSRL